NPGATTACVNHLTKGSRFAREWEQCMLSSTISPRALLLCALVGLSAPGMASAQSYPSGAVKLIVPVRAGGVTDTMARIVAQLLTEIWGQGVVVDNRPGG